MSDLKTQITELAHLMEEFGLDQAKLKGEDWKIEFSRLGPAAVAPVSAATPTQDAPRAARQAERPKPAPKAAPAGTPITSPMMGIYYSSPSPGTPPFVKLGDTVTAGQVIGLIEAMKVFNEITATASGSVLATPAENGQLVQPGDTLITVG